MVKLSNYLIQEYLIKGVWFIEILFKEEKKQQVKKDFFIFDNNNYYSKFG